MKKLIFPFVFIVSAWFQVEAQESYSVQYSIGIPSGNLNDFIDHTSFRGMLFEYQFELTSEFVLGFAGGFNTFYESKSYNTYTEGTISLSGYQYRYTNTFPLLFTFDYFLATELPIDPFIGIGIGTIFSERRVDMGLFESKVDEWQFGLQPEIGVIYRANELVGLKVAGKYFQGFDTTELEGQSYYSINVGLVFTSRY